MNANLSLNHLPCSLSSFRLVQSAVAVMMQTIHTSINLQNRIILQVIVLSFVLNVGVARHLWDREVINRTQPVSNHCKSNSKLLEIT